ncbi:MAG: hypothetical protein R3D30_10020 [Hyphomicrobiales bacterium]
MRIAPTDDDYAAMVRRAAGRFWRKVIEERTYAFDAANPQHRPGQRQICIAMPEVTQGAASHDVVWVVDTIERFGEYVPYRVYEAKPWSAPRV